MKQIEFYRALKQHCAEENGQCEKCCLRLYCYTPPCEMTDSMMAKVIQFLQEHTHIENQSHLDRYISLTDRPCICTMDIQTAIGNEDRP